MRNQRDWQLFLLGALLFALALAPTPAWAGDLGRCATAWIPHPVVLPDGSVHDPGALRLCMKSHSPNSGTYEIAVNGRAIGQWPGRLGLSEQQSQGYSLAVFEWVDDRLALIGYARPAGEQMRTYVFHQYGPVPERVLHLRDSLLDEDNLVDFIVYATHDRTR